jgi:manganese transport protein
MADPEKRAAGKPMPAEGGPAGNPPRGHNGGTVAVELPQSLEEVHSTISISYPGLFRRLFAFMGPAYLISVGYMDPGNWATDIEGGARFNYELIWVLFMSNLMAVLLQTLSARLGIVTGRDLAQACRDTYSRHVSSILWVLCEIAITACDLAEVIGTVVGLQLLFGLPPIYGLIVTAFDTFLFLAIQRLGMRKMEGAIVMLVATIGLCYLLEIIISQPQWGQVLRGFIPPLRSTAPYLFSSDTALYVAIGILGATVMPHNLYLHSALVQTRQVAQHREGVRQACRYNLIDSLVALNIAFFINAAILVMAGATFFQHPESWKNLGEIQLQDAHVLLKSLLGPLAGGAFAVALLASGQSSTVTGTLAGQVVMEGFVKFRMRPSVRRLATRLLAIAPALLAIWLAGEKSMMALLVLSQVVLSLQLPFAVVPLLQFTGEKRRMGEFVNPLWVRLLGWITVAIIIGLNGRLVWVQIADWIVSAGPYAIWIEATVLPITLALSLLLVWLMIAPWVAGRELAPAEPGVANIAAAVAAGLIEPLYRRIGVAVDNSLQDAITLRHAAGLARGHNAELVLIHVVEGVGGQFHGAYAADEERRSDQAYLEQLTQQLRKAGLKVRPILRFGNPAQELSRAIADEHIDLLVLGSHGHGVVGDRVFGETTATVRHAVHIPVLAVREPPP